MAQEKTDDTHLQRDNMPTEVDGQATRVSVTIYGNTKRSLERGCKRV